MAVDALALALDRRLRALEEDIAHQRLMEHRLFSTVHVYSIYLKSDEGA